MIVLKWFIRNLFSFFDMQAYGMPHPVAYFGGPRPHGRGGIGMGGRPMKPFGPGGMSAVQPLMTPDADFMMGERFSFCN